MYLEEPVFYSKWYEILLVESGEEKGWSKANPAFFYLLDFH